MLNPLRLANQRHRNRPVPAHTGPAQSRKKHPETIPAPTEFTPEGIPKTSAASVIVVDANSGKTLYEKNPDQFRAPASTQKLLTALIVAESGFLDRQVTVQPTDTIGRAGEAEHQSRATLISGSIFCAHYW